MSRDEPRDLTAEEHKTNHRRRLMKAVAAGATIPLVGCFGDDTDTDTDTDTPTKSNDEGTTGSPTNTNGNITDTSTATDGGMPSTATDTESERGFENVHGLATGNTYQATSAGVRAAIEDEPDQNGGIYIPSGIYEVESPIQIEGKDGFGIHTDPGATFRPVTDTTVWKFVTSKRLYVEQLRVADENGVQSPAEDEYGRLPVESASAGVEIDTCRFSNFEGFVIDNTANGLVFNSQEAGTNSSRFGHVITNNIRDTGLLFVGKSLHDNTFVNVHLRMAPNSRAGWFAKANLVTGGNYMKSIRVFGGPADGIHYNQSRGLYAGTVIVDLGGSGGAKNANVRIGSEFDKHMYVDRMWLAGGSDARKETPDDPSYALHFEDTGDLQSDITINSVYAFGADGAGINLNSVNRWWIGRAIARANTGKGISLTNGVSNGGFGRVSTADNQGEGLTAPGVDGDVHVLSRHTADDVSNTWTDNVSEVLASSQ